MGVKTIRVCDITGEPLVSPVKLGFVIGSEQIILEVNMGVAEKLVFALASRLSAEEMEEATKEAFGKNWLDDFRKAQNSG